jgi:hypothetical protein
MSELGAFVADHGAVAAPLVAERHALDLPPRITRDPRVAHHLLAPAREAQLLELGFSGRAIRASEGWNTSNANRASGARCRRNAREARELILEGVEVLERAERREDQREARTAEIEALHRRTHERKSRGRSSARSTSSISG